jgi:hypothetical protein
MTHKINFEVASERATVKEHMLLPPNDGQWKHPEHLQQHEMLQVLQRESLNGNWAIVRKMISELSEHQKKDTIEMLRRANKDPLIGKNFPDDIQSEK